MRRFNRLSVGDEKGFLFAFPSSAFSVSGQAMSNFDSDGSPESEWDERGDLAWNEFDWERYLREQDEAIHRYLRFYEACYDTTNRIDAVAEKMGWGLEDWSDESEDETDETAAEPDFGTDDDVYTLHKNPIFIATKAIYLGLNHSWETLAVDSSKVQQPLAVGLLGSLHRGEEQATQAIHALDFGDYAMAVSLFKRALSALNSTLALLNGEQKPETLAWRNDARRRLFDLREIWLRVIAECRDELDRPVDDEG